MNNRYANVVHSMHVPQVVVLEMSYLFFKNFNYLIIDPGSRQAVIVDPAWEMGKLDQALKDARASLSGVLITHTHPDHINLAKSVSKKYDCPISMSEQEISWSGFTADRLLPIDETPWFIGDMRIQPILTPGHTPGCICYLIGDNLFSGDVLFAEGCGMCRDIEAAHKMFNSLDNLKSLLKSETRIFPGHSYGKIPGQMFSNVLQDNIYLQFSDKETFAAFRLRKGQSKSSMFKFS